MEIFLDTGHVKVAFVYLSTGIKRNQLRHNEIGWKELLICLMSTLLLNVMYVITTNLEKTQNIIVDTVGLKILET